MWVRVGWELMVVGRIRMRRFLIRFIELRTFELIACIMCHSLLKSKDFNIRVLSITHYNIAILSSIIT